MSISLGRGGTRALKRWWDTLETMHRSSSASVNGCPRFVCAILQVTDIELEKGETITHINLGDSIRWTVESAVSGSRAEQVNHLIVKPRDIGLSTSLIVTTDRRTYHLLLVSDEKEFFHDVTFVYSSPPPVVAAATPVPSPSPVAKDPPTPKRRKESLGKAVASDPPDDADEDYVVRAAAQYRATSLRLVAAGSMALAMSSALIERAATAWPPLSSISGGSH